MLLISLVLFFTFTVKAQEPLQADAGENQHFCFATDYISTVLGGNPTAFGGIAPYSYHWWTNDSLNMIFSPTDSNPSLFFLGNITVYVEDTDATENTAVDSVIISMSNQQLAFSDNLQNLQRSYYINEGDSVFLNGNVLVLNPNSTFSWSPCESITGDCSVSDGFWTKPTVTTEYYLTAKDEFNCSETFFTHFYKVFVDNVGITDNHIFDNVVIYPNPVNNSVYIKTEKAKSEVKLYSPDGKLLQQVCHTKIDLSNYSDGIYFLSVNGKIFKIIKN